MNDPTVKSDAAHAAPSAPASVRDNAYTFDGPDDFGMGAVVRRLNALDAAAVHSACGISLEQYCDALLHAFPPAAHSYVSATLEAAGHNHGYLWTQYQNAALSTDATGESMATQQLQYPASMWQALEAAIPVAYTAAIHNPHFPDSQQLLHSTLGAIAYERECIAPLFRQGFQDAELCKRSELAAIYLHAMVIADFLYAAAVGCALHVPSPEMWPTPPEVWKPHRAAMASVERATAVAQAVR